MGKSMKWLRSRQWLIYFGSELLYSLALVWLRVPYFEVKYQLVLSAVFAIFLSVLMILIENQIIYNEFVDVLLVHKEIIVRKRRLGCYRYLGGRGLWLVLFMLLTHAGIDYCLMHTIAWMPLLLQSVEIACIVVVDVLFHTKEYKVVYMIAAAFVLRWLILFLT